MVAAEYACALDPESGATLRLHLYRDVKNVAEIREKVLSAAWKCTVIKPSLILHPFQVAVAANKAVLSQRDGTMVTRSLFSEVLFNLSLSKNISQSLSKFGIEKDENILIAFIVKSGEEDSCESILSRVEGDPCPVIELPKFADVKLIRSVYKLNKLETSDKELLDIIVSRMATKSFVSH